MSANRIVHLGLGNFTRAHQAVYTADAPGEWTMTGVTRSNRRLADALRAQDNRYTLVEIGPGAAAPRTMDVLDDVLVWREQPDQVMDVIAEPSTAVVTLTVTEKGYGYRGGSHDLDVDDPALRSDLAGNPPQTAIGVLAGGLIRRAAGGAPITLVSCDNVGENGDGLASALRQFADALGGPEGAALGEYLTQVATPNTMVDRIVPATTDALRERVRELGFDDQVPVPAEPFTMWVLQDVPGDRPRWEDAGAIVTDEVANYELVKLRLLNAANSWFAYFGLLTGRTMIAEAAVDQAIRAGGWKLGDEMQPTIELPTGFDPIAYREEVFGRFTNLALGHTCQQVGSDGSAKLTQRVPGPVAWHAGRDEVPSAIALLTAAWLYVSAFGDHAGPGRQPIPAASVPDEPRHDLLRTLGAQAGAAGLARAALVDEHVLGLDLATRTSFVDLVSEQLSAIDAGDVVGVLEELGKQ